jgi:hypothetical protein
MNFTKLKANALQILKMYEDYEGDNNLAGICGFIKWMSIEIGFGVNDVMYDMYHSLGIISLDYDNGTRIGSGKNWLRIAVVKLMIEALEDPSVYIANKDYWDYDLYSYEPEGQNKIKKLKDFIKLHQR